jgi:hypothetical protein
MWLTYGRRSPANFVFSADQDQSRPRRRIYERVEPLVTMVAALQEWIASMTNCGTRIVYAAPSEFLQLSRTSPRRSETFFEVPKIANNFAVAQAVPGSATT